MRQCSRWPKGLLVGFLPAADGGPVLEVVQPFRCSPRALTDLVEVFLARGGTALAVYAWQRPCRTTCYLVRHQHECERRAAWRWLSETVAVERLGS